MILSLLLILTPPEKPKLCFQILKIKMIHDEKMRRFKEWLSKQGVKDK
jgi:hypothetical protein